MSIYQQFLALTKNDLFVLPLLTAIALIGSIISLGLHIPLFYGLGLFLLVLGLYFAFTKPIPFLIVITILRMSLDYSAQFIGIQVTDTLALNLSQLMSIGVIAIAGVFLLAHIRHLKDIPLALPIGLFLLFATSTLFSTISISATLKELLRTFSLFSLFGFSYIAFQEARHIKNILLAILGSSIVPVSLALYQYINNVGFVDQTFALPRIFGTFVHPNVLGLYLVLAIGTGILYYAYFAKTTASRAVILASEFVYLVVLTLTFTRIAWATLLLFLLILALARYKYLIIPLILIPILLFSFISPIRERVSIQANPQANASFLWRIDLWQDTTSQTLVNDRLLLGYGFSTFPLAAENFRGNQFGSTFAHNDFVRLFVEGGIIGLTAYIIYIGGVFFVLFNRYQRAKREDKLVWLVLLALWVSFILASLTDNVLRHTAIQWIWLVLLGASFGTLRHPRNLTSYGKQAIQ
jgi:O-antigen ligase